MTVQQAAFKILEEKKARCLRKRFPKSYLIESGAAQLSVVSFRCE